MKNKAESPLLKTKAENFVSTNKYCILSFAIPFVVMFIVYAISGVHPFGQNQILVTDFWHQYYPFMVELQNKLQHGGSLLYSWNTGLGSNFLSIIAYYCASPLNLLTALFPLSCLREVATLFVITKISCAGLFMSIFLRKAFDRNGPEILYFSLGYAFSAFMIGYSWNIMWLDSAALFPLVALGIRSLFFEKKYKLYVISLALAIWSNYYIGYMICIFTALYFFFLVASNKRKVGEYFSAFLRIAIFSVIAVAMTAVLLLPAYFALQLAYKSGSVPEYFKFSENILEVLAKLVAFEAPNVKVGLPNIYCGTLPILFAPVFFVSKKFKLREKISYIVLTALMFFSCCSDYVNYVWHGFHVPNMVPFRFSFLISFIIIEMAFRAFTDMQDNGVKKNAVASMLFTSAVFLVLSYMYNNTVATFCALALMIIYIIVIYVLYLKEQGKAEIPMKAITASIAILVIGEMIASTGIGIKEVRVSDYTSYPSYYSSVKPLLDQINEDTTLCRTEMTKNYTLNDPALYSYKGVSQFSSTAVCGVTSFLKGLGLAGGEAANRYYYAQTSEFTNSILGIKYLIAKDGFLPDDIHFIKIGESGYSMSYQNLYTLPIAYMTEESVYDYEASSSIPILNQNEFFTAITGVADELFNIIDTDTEDSSDLSISRINRGVYTYRPTDEQSGKGKMTFIYTAPHDGLLYAYVSTGDSNSFSVVGDNEHITKTFPIESGKPRLLCIGDFSAGEKITITTQINQGVTGSIYMHVAQMDEDSFLSGYSTLCDEIINISDYSDTQIKGTITAKKDGVLFTTIPYEEGWALYVDGEKTEIEPVRNAFVAAKVTAGTHDIELKYSPKGFTAGAIISVSAIVIFAAIWIFRDAKRKEE